MSLRVLLVSVETPPSLNPESFQVGKILTALRRHPGLVVEVATAEAPQRAPGSFADVLGSEPSPAAPSAVVVVACRLRRLQRLIIRTALPWLINRPDWWFLFPWRWRQVLKQLRHAPDLIYSRSFPISSTLAAYRLAQHYDVPWFLHLSDAWCESSIVEEPCKSRWHQRQEARCLQRAQRISFTSVTTLERYRQRYPQLSDRMVVDPNSYTSAQVNQQPWQPAVRFRLVYTGSFTLKRRPDTLFQVLAALPADHPLLQDLTLIHAGPVDRHTRRLFSRAGAWLDDRGSVPAPVAHEMQLEADLLLVVDYRFGNPRDAQYLPSKLTDYMAIRRPVLAITDRGSASWQFVQANRLGVAIDHGDPAGITNALIDYWQAWRKRQRDRFELPPPSPAYSAEEVAKRLAVSAWELVRGGGKTPAA